MEVGLKMAKFRIEIEGVDDSEAVLENTSDRERVDAMIHYVNEDLIASMYEDGLLVEGPVKVTRIS